MKSVRLDAEVGRMLDELVKLADRSASAVIRDSIRAHYAATMQRRLDRRLSEVVGKVSSGGGHSSRDTGRAFTELLLQQQRPRKRRA